MIYYLLFNQNLSAQDAIVFFLITCKDRLVHYYEKFGFVNEGKSASVHGGAVWYDMRLTF